MKKNTLMMALVATACALPMIASANFGAPAPTPPVSSVPEPSTIIAGALLLVPLTAGAVRAMRKPRK